MFKLCKLGAPTLPALLQVSSLEDWSQLLSCHRWRLLRSWRENQETNKIKQCLKVIKKCSKSTHHSEVFISCKSENKLWFPCFNLTDIKTWSIQWDPLRSLSPLTWGGDCSVEVAVCNFNANVQLLCQSCYVWKSSHKSWQLLTAHKPQTDP